MLKVNPFQLFIIIFKYNYLHNFLYLLPNEWHACFTYKSLIIESDM